MRRKIQNAVRGGAKIAPSIHSADFCNSIGTTRKNQRARSMSGSRRKRPSRSSRSKVARGHARGRKGPSAPACPRRAAYPPYLASAVGSMIAHPIRHRKHRPSGWSVASKGGNGASDPKDQRAFPRRAA
jgi:hypothetical protein